MTKSSKKTCLVLGATGFIGGHIARRALAEGFEVRGLRRDPNSVGHLVDTTIDWHLGNLLDFNSLVEAMRGVDVVFHAAAFYPTRSNPGEVQAQVDFAKEQIERVVEAAKQTNVERFIYTSSLTTIGNLPPDSNRLADERDIYISGTLAKSAYYEAKITMESHLLAASRQGFPAVVLNPTAVFGPGDVHLTLGRILLAVKRGMVIAWVPVTTNVIDVRDVAAGHLAAVNKGKVGERYILGAYNMSVKTLIDLMATQFNVHPPRFQVSIRSIEKFVKFVDHFPRLSTGNHMRALPYWQSYNTEKAEKELGLTHRPFEKTLVDAITWFRQNGVKI